MISPARPTPPVSVLAVMDFAGYEPYSEVPGEEIPPPEPEPVIPEEPEPLEESPTLVESESVEAEVVPPPPVEIPKEKPKNKPKKKSKIERPPTASPSDATSSSGQSGSGDGVIGGRGTAVPDALRSYQTKIQVKLERYKKYPPSAREGRVEGVVLVRFTVNRNGEVVSSQIVKGSGFSILDDEGLGLLKRVNPFPPIPKEIENNTLTITAPLQFKIKRL
jgi:protein TonB